LERLLEILNDLADWLGLRAHTSLSKIGLEDLLFATEKETILLAIVVKFCQRISGAGFRTDKYLRSLATARSKTESSLHED
jgi:hypothetical protein